MELRQLSFWDFFDMEPLVGKIPEAQAGAGFPEGKETEPENYLDRDERILSLAKEAFQKKMEDFRFHSMEESIHAVKRTDDMSIVEMVQKLARQVFRPYLASCYQKEQMETLLSLMDFDLTISEPEKEAEDFFKQVTKPDRLLRVELREKGYAPLVMYGDATNVHQGSDKNLLFKKGFVYTDLGYLFAWLYLLSRINQYLRKGSRFPGKLSAEKVKEAAVHTSRLETGRVYLAIESSRLLQFSDSLLSMAHEVLGLPEENRILYEKRLSAQQRKNGMYYLGNEELKNLLFSHDPARYVSCQGGLEYHCLLPKKDSTYFGIPTAKLKVSSIHLMDLSFLSRLMHASLYEQSAVYQQFLYYKALDRDYALSCQTKKQIPEKTLEHMKHSTFNDFFGYVEFDELCDLKKIKELELEFSAFMKTWFPEAVMKDHAIRFRRLGNHKAAGLYYPFLKCLCVDIKHPDSVIHEFGHLLDYTHGSLSSGEDFSMLRQLYREYILSRMEEDGDFKKQMKSKTKYNLDYYLTPTEIFARSFELYCHHCLSLRNSLLPADFPTAYCQTEQYLGLVGDYFSRVFRITV